MTTTETTTETTDVAADHLGRRPAGIRPRRAMVLAAGLGTRMRPITDDRPKPLVPVAERTLLDRILDRLDEFGVEDVVVNLHYRGDMIEAHLSSRDAPAIRFSREEALLDTGGGIVRALPMLGDDPFIAANGDVLWLNGPVPALDRLASQWDAEAMDGLLMMHATVDANGYDGKGDFLVDSAGMLSRCSEKEVSPFLFAGVQILHPRLFDDVPDGAFSMNLLWDRAIEAGRLFGMVHDGEWFHIGTPEGLTTAEDFISMPFAETRHR